MLTRKSLVQPNITWFFFSRSELRDIRKVNISAPVHCTPRNRDSVLTTNTAQRQKLKIVKNQNWITRHRVRLYAEFCSPLNAFNRKILYTERNKRQRYSWCFQYSVQYCVQWTPIHLKIKILPTNIFKNVTWKGSIQ